MVAHPGGPIGYDLENYYVAGAGLIALYEAEGAKGVAESIAPNAYTLYENGLGNEKGQIAAIQVTLDVAAVIFLKKCLPAKAQIKTAPKRLVEKSWKDIIHGKAHGTTPGHKFRSYREAIKKAKSGEYSDVYLNTGYKKTTGVNVSPNRRPDVTGVKTTGQVDVVEVVSKTDDPAILLQRNIDAQIQLPPIMRGNIDIVYPQ